MKQLLFLVALLFVNISLAQKYKSSSLINPPRRPSTTCEQGTQAAVDNFKQGVYISYSYGLQLIPTHGSQEYFQNYMLKTYNIQFLNGGCSVTPSKKCYSKKMSELLENKYGKGYFEKARVKARLEYEKTN